MNHNLIYYILRDISKRNLNGRMVSYMYQDIIDETRFIYEKELKLEKSPKEFGRFKIIICFICVVVSFAFIIIITSICFKMLSK